MLVLSRKAGEKIIIGNTVTVTILSVFGNRLRIGIDAPKQIQIRRMVLVKQDDSIDANYLADSTQDPKLA